MTLIERIRFQLRMLRLALIAKPMLGAEDPDPAPDPKNTPDPEPDPDPDPEPSDEKVSKAELDKVSRRLAEAEKAKRKAEKELKAAAEAKAEDEGKWKELAEQREKEAEQAKQELAKAKQRSVVEKVAKRLNFADPDDAIRNLDAEVDSEDETAIERELKAVLEAKPHLKDDPGDGSRPVRTKRKDGGKTDPDKLIRGMAGR